MMGRKIASGENEAHLEQDVGGVEVPRTDALAMHVLHATHDALQDGHDGPPSALHAWLQKTSGCDRHAKAASIAVLLHTPIQVFCT